MKEEKNFKAEYMDSLITEAREPIKCGELEIALEGMLENLSEVSFIIDEETVNLARQTFDIKTSVGIEKIINSLVKKY